MKKALIEIPTTNYRMTVTIIDPLPKNAPMVQHLRYRCSFYYDPEQYGNGFYLSIKNDHGGYFQGIDLRYDRSFKKSEKEKWLEQWVKNYWNGKNGAWLIKNIEIIKE